MNVAGGGWSDGDDGLMLTFPVAGFAQVAAIIRCYKAPPPRTERQLEALAAGRKLFQPSRGQTGLPDAPGQGG